jgi:hypothetical protein
MAFALKFTRVARASLATDIARLVPAELVAERDRQRGQHLLPASGELEQHIVPGFEKKDDPAMQAAAYESSQKKSAERPVRIQTAVQAGIQAAATLASSMPTAVNFVTVEINGHLEHDGSHQVGALVWPCP